MGYRLWSLLHSPGIREHHKPYFVVCVLLSCIIMICHFGLVGAAIDDTFPPQTFGTVGLDNIGTCLILSIVVGCLYFGLVALWMFAPGELTRSIHTMMIALGVITIASSGIAIMYTSSECTQTYIDIAVARWHLDPRVVDFMREKQCMGLSIGGDECGDECCDELLEKSLKDHVSKVRALVIADIALVAIQWIAVPIVSLVSRMVSGTSFSSTL